MRHLFSIIVFLFLFHIPYMAYGIYEYKRTSVPDPILDSCAVSIYEYYTLPSHPFSIPAKFSIKYHTEISGFGSLPGYKSDTIGQWRLSNDTMLIYENYFYPGVDSTLTDNQLLEIGSAAGLVNSYRSLVDLIPIDADYPFDANISAFRVYYYGDIICAIESSGTSTAFIYTPKSICKYGAINVLSPLWQWSRFDWRSGEFMVRNRKEAGGKTLIVELEKDGVIFRAVNPKYYLKNDAMDYYDKRDEAALTQWMDSVKTGSRHRFTLQRPDYPADSAKNVRYLRTLPDSLYISRAIDLERLSADQRAEIANTVNPDTCREAYGYFFAKMIE